MSDLAARLAAQRAAFDAELPVPLALRKGRLRRAAAMIRDHQKRFRHARAPAVAQSPLDGT